MKQINSDSQLNEVIKGEGLVFVLKHSSTCPISQAAFTEYEKFAQGHSDLDCYYLIVQDAGSLSNYISEKFNIKHESPQAIMFKNGNANWHASHWKITHSLLNSVLKENE
ncbi:MAG TPA: bacillithiol system redox-active protein YtxJ [Pseudoneobacillus sp.]|nr:bacillithiol system redox-active protein YtxJ [Pseudoneobacillus sp.]